MGGRPDGTGNHAGGPGIGWPGSRRAPESSGSSSAGWSSASVGCRSRPRAPGFTVIVPVRGPAAQGQHADRHDAGARPGGHHPRQRDRAGGRGRVLPGRATRPAPSSRSRTTSSRSRRWRRPHCVRSSARASWTTCCRNREQLNEGLELMIDSPAMGWGVADRPGGDQGRRPAGDDEAVDVAPGRGRAGAAGPDHHRRRRVPGIEEARRRPPR